MAAAAQSLGLQQQIHKGNTHLIFQQYRPCYSPPQFRSNTFASVNFKKIPTKSFKNLSVKYCPFPINNSSSSINGDSNHQEIKKVWFPKNTEIKRNPVIEIASETLINALNALRKPAATAAVVLGLLVLMMYNNNNNTKYYALAASDAWAEEVLSLRVHHHHRRRRLRGANVHHRGNHYYSSSSESSAELLFTYILLGFLFLAFAIIALAPFAMVASIWEEISMRKTSVLKLQVGLSGMGTSLQKDLNGIAEAADTSTPNGFHSILTDTVLALLRYPDNCISAYSSIDVKWDMDEGEKLFYELCFEERCKLDEETLVNVNNIKKQSSTAVGSSGLISNKHMVVTILVTARREQKLPCIKNSKDLKDVLKKVGSLRLSRIVAVEVIWTPQKEDDTLSEEELLEKYPLLQPLQKV